MLWRNDDALLGCPIMNMGLSTLIFRYLGKNILSKNRDV
jgi:hypothetical protein